MKDSEQSVIIFCTDVYSINMPVLKCNIYVFPTTEQLEDRTSDKHRRFELSNQMHSILCKCYTESLCMHSSVCIHRLFSRFINPHIRIVPLYNSVIMKLSSHDGA